MASIFERDQSTIGTGVGVAVCLIAAFGTTFLGWDWSEPTHTVPVVLGIAAVVFIAIVGYGRYRN